jgi:hypothetical protein
MNIWNGTDVNNDGVINDIATTAYKFTGVDDQGKPSYEEMGPCETVQCGRGASFSQMNLRLGKRLPIGGSRAIELFGEVFNLFNAKNPNMFSSSTSSPLVASSRVLTGTGAPNPEFMKPLGYAGDIKNPEQRVGQLGVRFVF